MLKRSLLIALFHARVVLTKLIIIAITVPIAFVMIPVWVARRQGEWAEYLDLFSPKEWRAIFGNTIEAAFGCRWYVTDPKLVGSPEFPSHTFWDGRNRMICCLFLDDAVQMNLTYGGSIKSRSKIRER